MGKRVIKIIKEIIDEILDIIYPPDNKCISCLKEDYIGLCEECTSKIKRAYENEEIISYGYYGGVLKKLILSFKYNRNFLSGRILGDFLCVLIKENKIKADMVVYVPMSKKSIKKRGFNQCKIMAEVISKEFNIPISGNLIKIKETKEQKILTRDERRNNVLDVFDVISKSEFIGKNIILIDDVVTTGVTIKECEKILKKHGACTINLLTVAKSNI